MCDYAVAMVFWVVVRALLCDVWGALCNCKRVAMQLLGCFGWLLGHFYTAAMVFWWLMGCCYAVSKAFFVISF